MVLGELYVKIGADTKELSAGLTQARGQVKKTTEQMRAQMKTLGMGMVIAGAAITAAFALTVKSAISFQKQLAQVSTMLDKSAMKIMPQYKSGLLKMSAAFGESTDTLSRGLYDILSASIPPTQALEVLGVAAKAATAGITDTGVAADAITTILNSYGMSADKAGEVSDILFAIVKRGKLTFDELAPSIGKVAAMAAKTGLSFEELGAMIATVTRAGIRTDEAMTSINGVLRAFLKPSTEAATVAWEKFKFEMNTTTLRTIGLTGVMEKLSEATAEQLAQIFPNIRGLKGLIAALGDAEGYTKDYELMLNSAGLTQVAFEKQSATLGFKIDQLKESFKVISVTIGDTLIPAVQSGVEWLGKMTFEIKELMDIYPKLTEAIFKFGAAFGILVGAGGALILANLYFAKLAEVLIGIKGTIALLTTAVAGLALAFTPLAAAIAGAIVNTFIWWNVYKKVVELIKSGITTTKDITEAENRLAEAQAKTAEKFGITVEQYREYLKEGLSIIEMLERAHPTLKVWTESIIEQQVAAHEIITTVKDLTQEISLLSKEYELTNKSIAESLDYYSAMIEKVNQVDVILQTELMLLKEGTEEYNKKKEEILDNLKVLKEYQEALAGIMVPLEGLDLITAQIGLLGDSFVDNQAKMILLEQEADILKQKIKEAIPETEKWWEWSNALKDNEEKIKSLSETIAESELARLDAKLAYLNAKFKESGENILGYREKISILNDIMVILKQRLEEAEPDTEEWYRWAIAIETNEDKIRELNQALKDLQSSTKETKDALGGISNELVKTGEAGKEAGEEIVKSWTLVGDTIKRATISLSNFTKEGVAAAIANIKMKFYPAIQSLTENIANLFESMFFGSSALTEYYERQIENLTESMNEQIDTVLYGYQEYLRILAEMETGGGGAGFPSYQFGTPYVPRTGLALVHKGERITPANQNTYNNTFSPTVNLTVQGGGNPNRIAQEVEKVLYDTGRQFKRRGFEIIPGRG